MRVACLGLWQLTQTPTLFPYHVTCCASIARALDLYALLTLIRLSLALELTLELAGTITGMRLCRRLSGLKGGCSYLQGEVPHPWWWYRVGLCSFSTHRRMARESGSLVTPAQMAELIFSSLLS